MAIDFSNVTKVMYGAQEVVKIQQGTTTLWEKAVDPTANLISFQGNTTLAEYTSGALMVKGRYNNDTNALSSFKVWWTLRNNLNNPNAVDSNKKIIFPYTTSRTGSTNSKFGIGSARANSSNAISSSSAVYGLQLTDGFDMSSYFKENVSGNYDFYGGSFTISPGSSSTYSNKCLAGLLLENLYKDGSQVTPDGINISEMGSSMQDYGFWRIWVNDRLWSDGDSDFYSLNYKLLLIRIYITNDNYFEFAVAIEVS